MNKGLWAASLFLFIVGLLLIAAQRIRAEYIKQKDEGRGHVKATIVELVLRERPDADLKKNEYRNAYYPVFEYYADGMLYKKTGKRGSYPSKFKVGEKVSIEYDLEDPNRYRLVKSDRKRIIWDAAGIAGSVLAVLGVLIFIRFAVRG